MWKCEPQFQHVDSLIMVELDQFLHVLKSKRNIFVVMLSEEVLDCGYTVFLDAFQIILIFESC